jgi:hypothetical protein
MSPQGGEWIRVRCVSEEKRKRKDLTINAIMFGRRLFNLFIDEVIVDLDGNNVILTKGDWYDIADPSDVDAQRLIELCRLHLL